MWRIYFLAAVIAVPALLIRGCNALQRVSHDGSNGVNRRGGRIANLHLCLHPTDPRGAAALGGIMDRLGAPRGERDLDEWAGRLAGMERWRWNRSLGWERFPQPQPYIFRIDYGNSYRNDPELVWEPQFGIVIE